jgi:hypothetical protein
LVSLPFGRQFAGQPSAAVAADQLFYKSGYKADFEYIGLVSLISEGDHLLIQVYTTTNLTGEHGSDGLTGISFWAKVNKVDSIGMLPGTPEILSWIGDRNRPSYLEVKLTVDPS